VLHAPELAPVWAAASADPIFKAREVFGIWPWSKEREILWSVRRNRLTAVPSCHGVGKTHTAATVVLDYITEGPCRVVTTAPIWSQVKDLLWAEIAVRHRDSRLPIGGQLDLTRLTFGPDHFAVGFSTDQPEQFAGHHSPRLLLVVDEASGVDERIYNASKGFLTAASPDTRVLLIGNPTKPAGTFFRACRADSPYNVIHMSAFDSPNLTGEEVPKKLAMALTSKQWVDEMKEEFGEDSAEYRIRVLGQFASTIGRGFYNGQMLDLAESLCEEPIHRGKLIGDPVRGSGAKINLLEQLIDISVTVWERRDPGHKYVMFADVAGAGISVEEQEARPVGKKDDYCAALVMDLDTGRVVAQYHAQVDEEEYGRALACLGFLYGEAEIAVETTGGYGQLTVHTLVNRYRYRKDRLYRRPKVDSVSGRQSHVVGWDTNSSTRPNMLTAARQHLKNQPNAVRSRDIIDEQRTFVWNEKGTRAEAQSGAHDDLAMAFAGVCLMREMRARGTIEIRDHKPKQPLSARAAQAAQAAQSRPVTRIVGGRDVYRRPEGDLNPSAAAPIIRRKRKLTVSQRAQNAAVDTMPGARRP